MRYKITDIDNESFYQLPKSLFTQKNYKGLSSDAKIIYSLLKDRMCLSRKNGWKDANGDIFLLFSQPDIGALLDLSASSVSRAMKKLVEYGLIDTIQQGLNRPNKIYINRVEIAISEDDITPPPPSMDPPAEKSQDDLLFPDAAIVPDLHICNSGLANMQVKTCTSAS